MSVKMNGSKHAAADVCQHREDILNAAIEVFGRAGYAAASTNEIVKRAQVSKGLLFHHFVNKEKLYIACQMHVMEMYGEYMEKHINLESDDYFDRVLHNLRIKMEFGRRHPVLLTLINRAWVTDNEENMLDRKAAEEYILKSSQGKKLATFFEGIDITRFREGFDAAKIINYTRLVLEASWLRFSGERNNDIQLIIKEIDSYIAEAEELIVLFKHGAYR